MGKSDPQNDNVNADADAGKPKRVRTGCLTCRERHLKCDEGLPHCQNCRKSGRKCRRGVRLNFMYIDEREPPVLLRSDNFKVRFEDNSREIADEYKGGLRRYRDYDDGQRRPSIAVTSEQYGGPSNRSAQQQEPQRTSLGAPSAYTGSAEPGLTPLRRQSFHNHSGSQSDSGYGSSNLAMMSTSSYSTTEPPLTPAKSTRNTVGSPYEALFLQVYIEEVAVWMDSLDPLKHFSRILPFHALEIEEPMLRNAMLACGAQHMWLVNENYRESTAQQYYHAAVEEMLNRLEQGDQDQELCAVTSSILNVYCLMCEKPLQRLNDIAAGRALIEKLKWNARTTGVGGACFWLNVGMDILSRLHFNSTLGGSLDKWELNMNFHDKAASQSEEIWAHRIMFLVAKICNFRATASAQRQQVSPQREESWLRQRYQEWCGLKDWVEQWHECIPRSMHPLSYLEPGVSLSQKTWNQSGRSTFPEIYLLKRITIIARLFFHTAMLLLAQTNPFAAAPGQIEEMRSMQHKHATYICGIVAHTKDRGVASVAIRSLAIAAECITELDQRYEIMHIFDQILKHTGWRLGVVMKAIQKGWGWAEEAPRDITKPNAPVDWSNANMNGTGQQYSLQEGMQMLHELVVQAETDPLPVPPSRQPFRLKPRPSSSHVPSGSHNQHILSQSQSSVPQLQQQHPSSQMRPTRPTSPQLPNHNHRQSAPTTSSNAVHSDSNFDLHPNTYQGYYIEPNMSNATSNMHFSDSNLNGLDASHTNMQNLNNSFNY